jgi:hypothetical protein
MDKHKQRFTELRAAGRSYEDIGKDLKTPVPTLVAWAQELKKELANARTPRAADMEDRFPVGKAKRVEVFGGRLNAILAELDKRDLSDVPTEKLLGLALKYLLKGEREPLELVGEDKSRMGGIFETEPETWPA